MNRIRFIALFLLLIFGSLGSVEAQNFYLKFKNVKQLKAFFQYGSHPIPLISAHRGGMERNFPENCIETFENTTRYTYAIIECDIQESADDSLVMMHDASLERTSTGIGRIDTMKWRDLQSLSLKDNFGQVTNFKIPTLNQVLAWAKGKVILMLDVKKNIAPEKIVALIRKHHAEKYAVVITYTLESALAYHSLHPELMISVSIRNQKEWEAIRQSGISLSNLVAFTGVGEVRSSLISSLHQQGIRCILGTMGATDQKAREGSGMIYQDLYTQGIDILTGDEPRLMADIWWKKYGNDVLKKSRFRRNFIKK
jgi:glycerophosphoryl diester phosphodiesterase